MFDESSPEPSTQPDTENHTKFHPDDADFPARRRLDGTETFEGFYRRLAGYNSGVRNGKWGDESMLWRQENLAIYDSIASQLDLTRYQKLRGRNAFDNLSLQELSSPGGIDTALVAVCVAAVVVREDGRCIILTGTKNATTGPSWISSRISTTTRGPSGSVSPRSSTG